MPDLRRIVTNRDSSSVHLRLKDMQEKKRSPLWYQEIDLQKLERIIAYSWNSSSMTDSSSQVGSVLVFIKICNCAPSGSGLDKELKCSKLPLSVGECFMAILALSSSCDNLFKNIGCKVFCQGWGGSYFTLPHGCFCRLNI